jgi:hypothetical protein
MSTATRHIETDALVGLREELLLAAGRRAARRRPARRAAIVVAILVGLLAATAATAALTDFTTGVPVVDELVGIEHGLPDRDGAPAADHRPGPGDATEPLAVQIGDGTYQTVAYLARDGSICIASAERHRGGVRGSFGGCPSLEDVNRQIERRGAVWFGSSHGPEQRTYQLIVAGEVESVRPLGEGDWKVPMTPPWTPEAPGARPLRLVVAIDDADIDVGGDGLQQDEIHLLETGFPKLELTYADGSTRIAEAP